MIRLYHNPRCSKSREALALLEAKGIDFETVEYLKSGLTEQVVRTLAKKLALKPSEFTRTSEEPYRELQPHTEEEHIAALVREPKLLQRPILETNTAAVIGRPPENVLQLV